MARVNIPFDYELKYFSWEKWIDTMPRRCFFALQIDSSAGCNVLKILKNLTGVPVVSFEIKFSWISALALFALIFGYFCVFFFFLNYQDTWNFEFEEITICTNRFIVHIKLIKINSKYCFILKWKLKTIYTKKYDTKYIEYNYLM